VDSGVLIEAFRGSSAIAISALAILNDANREFVTSEFVRLEVLPKPTFQRRLIEVAFYNAFFAIVAQSAPITRALVRLAMRRAEEFGLSAVDALHVAAAETTGAVELITSERPTSPLSRVTSIRVVSIHP
jgi:predicted nucleic acid-binding protein